MTLIERISKICGMNPINVEKILDNLDYIEDKKREIEHIIWHFPDGLVKDKERDDLINELNILAETPEETEAAIEALVEKIKEGGEVSINRNIERAPKNTVKLTKSSIIEGNGKTLYGEVNSNNKEGGDLLHISNGANVEIKNLNIKDNHKWDGKSSPAAALFIDGSSNVKLENVNVKGVYPIWVNGNDSLLTIKGGEYKSTVSQAIYVYGQSKIIIEDGTFEAPMWGNKNYCINIKDSAYNKTKPATDYVEIKGGRFINFNPAQNAENPMTSFVADGYKSVEVEPGVWEVVPE